MYQVEFHSVTRAVRLRCFHSLYGLYRMHSGSYHVPMDLLKYIFDMLKCQQEAILTFTVFFETQDEADLIIKILTPKIQILMTGLSHQERKRLIAKPRKKIYSDLLEN